nr:unnamed protein product [Spirometra erinaceieuropaei]
MTNRVEQGCDVAPTIFSLMFTAMLMNTYRDARRGIRSAYRTDAQLLNHQRMHFQSCVPTATIHELLFADDRRNVAAGSRRQSRQVRRYKDTLKTSPKRLQINPANWEDLARDRPTWQRTVKTGVAIYETTRITVAKVKHEARKSQLHPPLNANGRPPSTCLRCQRMFWAPHPVYTSRCPPPTPASSSTPITYKECSNESPLPFSSSSSYSSSSSIASTSATAAAVPNTIAHNSDIPKNINRPTVNVSNEDLVYSCPHCDCIFTSRTGLVTAQAGPRVTRIGQKVCKRVLRQYQQTMAIAAWYALTVPRHLVPCH